ncbi:MAG TPA: hypothetical protein VGC87_10060 [Pyrinomonadaceae bacterium]|jgi:hypothetical protein
MRLDKSAAPFLLALLFLPVAAGARQGRWRAATEQELRRVIPARAAVVKENIETEFRTASGVTDGRGHFIAGVVMITAGYSAEGKYSHFFVTQAAVHVDDLVLQPDEYVFGYQRVDSETMRLVFYKASSGREVGAAVARLNAKGSAVRSLLISPPAGGRGTIQLGRFVFDYRLD